MKNISVLALLCGGCTGSDLQPDGALPSSGKDTSIDDTGPPAPLVTALDVGIDVGFQEDFFDSYQRGRACLAADYDGDGRTDVFVGNPADRSYILLNRSTPGAVSFEMFDILYDGLLAFGGGPADYDNDGDIDLFLSVGGAEGAELDILLENRLMEDGVLAFVDVSAAAGLSGPTRGGSTPIPVQSAGSRWGDYDRDGDLDLFVNVSIIGKDITGSTCEPDADEDPYDGRNTLWQNNGDGTFTDVTDAVGLGDALSSTFQSSLIDVDNDGDLDLYENNYQDLNVLYQNMLAETGTASFAPWPNTLLLNSEPLESWNAFVSAVGDLNNDGWEDLVVLTREPTKTLTERGPRHLLFLNTGSLGRTGFIEASPESGLTNFVETLGVMGSQLGDLNGDGILDLFIGNGGPSEGNHDQLFLSTGYGEIAVPGYGALRIPLYEDRSELIDTPAQVVEGFTGTVPSFPYRTHGSCIVDFDGDGQPELAITNGGRTSWPDELAQSPDRLFEFVQHTAPAYLTVRPRGDGVGTPQDGTGTRIEAHVRAKDGTTWSIHRTLLGGNAFSAHNGFQLTLGLGEAVAVEKVVLRWPDGAVEVLRDVALNTTLTVTH